MSLIPVYWRVEDEIFEVCFQSKMGESIIWLREKLLVNSLKSTFTETVLFFWKRKAHIRQKWWCAFAIPAVRMRQEV